MSESVLELTPTKTVLNIRLGERMLSDLTESLSRHEEAKKPRIKEVLKQFADVVEGVLKLQRDNTDLSSRSPELDRDMSRKETLKNFRSLTSEERSLAAGYAVALIATPNPAVNFPETKDYSTPLLKTYRSNIERVINEKVKRGLASISGTLNSLFIRREFSQVMTGTTEPRIEIIEPAVRAILYGIVDPRNFYGQNMSPWDHDLRRDLYDKAGPDLKTRVESARLSLGKVVEESTSKAK